MNDKQETIDQKKMQLVDTLAQDFFEAFYTGRYSGDTSLPIADLSLDEAYLVQDKVTEKKIESGGGPLRSLRWLLGYLKRRNQYLKAGDFIIPGTPAVIVEIQEDTELSISVSRIGTITTTFKTRTRD